MDNSDLIRHLDQMYLTGKTKQKIVVDVYSCDGHWKETMMGTCEDILTQVLDTKHHSRKFTITIR